MRESQAVGHCPLCGKWAVNGEKYGHRPGEWDRLFNICPKCLAELFKTDKGGMDRSK